MERLAPACLLSALLSGCASTTGVMRSDASVPSTTVAFVSDMPGGSEPWLVYDEHGRYLGALVGRSRFEVAVEPGSHIFAAAPLLSEGDCVAVAEVLGPGSHSETRFEGRTRGREGIGEAVVAATLLRPGAGQRLVGAMSPAGACSRTGALAAVERN